MSDFISVNGPVERIEGALVLRIPLSVGGDQLAPLAQGIGRVEAGFLVVTVPAWLADKLGIVEGSVVDLDNADGKFNIRSRSQS